jgi:1-aminocyclopropane-1-carboxylate deaminase/D-cysteine desulfhydrase
MIIAAGISPMSSSDSQFRHALQAFIEFLPEIEPCAFDFAQRKLVQIDCLRLDKLHPFVSGNKWYKLKYSILHGYQSGRTRFMSFGGAYSNHLHALAYAGKHLNVETIGIVRGERPANLSPTLRDCLDWGMSLRWVAREHYRLLAEQGENAQSAMAQFIEMYPDAWVIPEGGAGEDGVLGVETLFNALHHKGVLHYDYLATPVGSGTTLAGMIRARTGHAKCLGFSALKSAHDLESRVERQLQDAGHVNEWQISHDYHFGGFAKMSERLQHFISDIYNQYGLLLDPVYTGKMLFGLAEFIHQGRIPPGSKVLMVHTGGLQGWRGFAAAHPCGSMAQGAASSV